MPRLTWEEVLRRDDIVGGDLEAQEGSDVYRGPIKRMWIEGAYVHTELEWCATMDRDARDPKWHKHHLVANFFDMAVCPPNDVGEGRIFFNMPFLGPVTIFPKGGSKLDPAQVIGLQLPVAANGR